jgi:hypothetical protein
MPLMYTSSTRRGGKEQPVKIITLSSVETIVFGNTEMNNDCVDAV